VTRARDTPRYNNYHCYYYYFYQRTERFTFT